MAPQGTLPKRKTTENQYLFNLGVQGRKTGLTVPDTGIRDEHGLEPMDHLFSSPEKPKTKKTNGYGKNANATISSEEDMDLAESTIPEPTTAITEQKRARLPPKSKSPIKTFLQSPARRNPSMGPVSSPVRSELASSVRRKLDFSNESYETNLMESSATHGSPQKRGNATLKASAKLSSGTRLAPHKRSFSPDMEQEDNTAQTAGDEGYEDGEDSFQMVNGGDEEELAEEPEDELEPEPEPTKKAKGKGKGKEPEVQEAPAKRGRGRKPKQPNLPVDEEVAEPPAKRTRRSLDAANVAPLQSAIKGKPGRQPKSVAAPKEPKPKPATKKSKLAPITEAESPEIQRGPPLPRNNRGLMILRRETPADSSGFKQTRSGRNSIKPLAFWRNERAEYSDDEIEDVHGSKFLTSRIKGVVRVDEIEEKRPKKSYYRPAKGKKPAAIAESEDELEPWEEEPGLIDGNVRLWDPEDPTGIMAPEEHTEIAFSSAAIRTRDVPGATFKFAKTLTLPFFGSGMLDLPAGTEKSVKNTRRMQMVFFVFSGRVEVTVNGNENRFSIGKGGLWQVPRGNTYSIVNDYAKPARIFFAQGCEVSEDNQEGQ